MSTDRGVVVGFTACLSDAELRARPDPKYRLYGALRRARLRRLAAVAKTMS